MCAIMVCRKRGKCQVSWVLRLPWEMLMDALPGGVSVVYNEKTGNCSNEQPQKSALAFIHEMIRIKKIIIVLEGHPET